MNPLYESHELMDHYLNGTLSEEEAMRFEQRLKSDPEFAELFEIHKITNQVIVGNELLSLKSRMAKDLSASPSFVNWKLWLGVGAAAAIVVAAWWYLQRDPAVESNSLEISKDSILPEEKKSVDTTVENKLETKEQQSEGKPENFCSDSIISFSCQTRGTCVGAEEGAIEIDVNTIKSGVPPYTFSIVKEGKFYSGSTIEGLAPGSYFVFVKDSKECIWKLKSQVDVSAVDCK